MCDTDTVDVVCDDGNIKRMTVAEVDALRIQCKMVFVVPGSRRKQKDN
ncbi:hypothetical protein [Proteus mirabilis]